MRRRVRISRIEEELEEFDCQVCRGIGEVPVGGQWRRGCHVCGRGTALADILVRLSGQEARSIATPIKQ
ncbi:MAG TPA: hypothetical protein VD926_05785 [Acidimicrobiales bacterium]|nr:hypothetical protein [Acidimicrobiales bacterium]